jgi:hypothetical protein
MHRDLRNRIRLLRNSKNIVFFWIIRKAFYSSDCNDTSAGHSFVTRPRDSHRTWPNVRFEI